MVRQRFFSEKSATFVPNVQTKMSKNTKKSRPTKNSRKKPQWLTQLQSFLRDDRFHFVAGVLLMLFAVYMLVAFTSYLFTCAADQSELGVAGGNFANAGGSGGAGLAHWLINGCFGISSYALAILAGACGLQLTRLAGRSLNLCRWAIVCLFSLIWLSLFLSLVSRGAESLFLLGGRHGRFVTERLTDFVGIPGVVIILLATGIIFSIYLSASTLPFLRRLLGGKITVPGEEETTDNETPAEEPSDAAAEAAADEEDAAVTVAFPVSEAETEPAAGLAVPFEMQVPQSETLTDSNEPAIVIRAAEETEKVKKLETIIEEQGPYDPRADLSRYKFPTLDLLNKGNNENITVDNEEQNANANRITEVLRSFGIEISSINATVGPTITLYEITPAPGVKISRIKNLEEDIALSLKALGIRIIAPMPGRGTIGIEVPNKKPQTVSMYSVLASRKFQDCDYALPVAIGKTITNEVFTFDLAKAPHLLVAGATGQGKSVGLNAIVTSLLYKKHPAELKLVLVDPKKVELSIYNTIDHHFLAKLEDEEDAIITDTDKVVATLKSLCKEMDDRYELLRKAGVRGIKDYNAKFCNRELNPNDGHRFLPYFVIVIDEYGDLIMTAGKAVELPICRIAQLARAVGMHMIIATQRPTTNIITGTIKANFPARIAFKVTSPIDSRVILERTGANSLVGRGDMLYLGNGDPVRIQCAFVDTPEVENIGKYIQKQQGYPQVFPLPEVVEEGEGGGGEALDTGKLDPLFEEAAQLVVSRQQGSTSTIQRQFALGYNRAGRIMDQLEQAGIVGPAQGSKPRQVLVQDLLELESKIDALKNR